MKKYSIIICTLLVLAGCSDWLSAVTTGIIDLLYYAAAMVLVALTLLYINCGTLRLYLFVAIALGIYLYARFPGRLIRAKKAKRAEFTKKQLR